MSPRTRHVLSTLGIRLFVQIPLILPVVSVLVFWLIQVVPGDPGRNALGQYATSAQVAAWNEANGMVGPLPGRYLDWLGGFLTGEWGHSVTYDQPVRPLILERLGRSIVLGIYAFVILVPVSILIGSFQAYRQGRRSDRVMTVLTMAVTAIPEFVIGVALLIVFAVWLGWAPVQSAIDPADGLFRNLALMTLPAITLAASLAGVLSRMVRSGVIETIRAPFHTTAVLKGLRPGRVLRKHVLRNALIPTVALTGMYLAGLLGGSAVVETLFNYPGLGALIVTAAEKKDILLLESGVRVAGVISLGAILLADLASLLMDPRIRFSAGELT